MRHFDPWGLLSILKDVVLLLVPAGAAAWAWYRTRHAQSWPSAQGTIMSAQAQVSKNSYIQRWVGNLSYSYVVDGEYYSGFYGIPARSERKAEEKIAGWKGRMVVVRYSPDTHNLSVLLRSDQPGGQLGN
jgi:predicted DNA-binding helix-hairpin-helix protein